MQGSLNRAINEGGSGELSQHVPLAGGTMVFIYGTNV